MKGKREDDTPEPEPVLARIGPGGDVTMNGPMRDALIQGSASDQGKFGSVLARHRKAAKLTPGEQAGHLGIDLDGLATLCLSRLPRPKRYDRDLLAVARRTGASLVILTAILVADGFRTRE